MLPRGVKGRVGVARGRRGEWGVIAWQVNGCVAVTTEASAHIQYALYIYIYIGIYKSIHGMHNFTGICTHARGRSICPFLSVESH